MRKKNIRMKKKLEYIGTIKNNLRKNLHSIILMLNENIIHLNLCAQ